MILKPKTPMLYGAENLPAILSLFKTTRDQELTPVDSQMVLRHREAMFDGSGGIPVDGWRWYALGLIYTFVGLDNSLIKLYVAATDGQGIDVPTARMPRPVIPGVPSKDAWMHILQGIPTARADDFESFVRLFTARNNHLGYDTSFTWADAVYDQIPYKILLPQSDQRKFAYADGEVQVAD